MLYKNYLKNKIFCSVFELKSSRSIKSQALKILSSGARIAF